MPPPARASPSACSDLPKRWPRASRARASRAAHGRGSPWPPLPPDYPAGVPPRRDASPEPPLARTAAILPVKRMAGAKRRLAASTATALRQHLAAAMVSDVLGALAQASAIARTIVVTCEPSVAAQARAQGAIVLEDAAEAGQSAAAAIGIARALAEGFERVLCVPGDCPALEPAELDRLLGPVSERGPEAAGSPRAEVLIVPDRHGTGTNGLLLTPPDVITPSFGPGSCERHRALARAAGAALRLEHPPSLVLDVDTGEDLAALRARLAGTDATAPRTRSVLGQPERRPILSISTTG
ncbi:MAG: 2-phospho-L-lactate guanylyltransferase [Actinobacteria bacterium]|nr:MAG: 2-phospho-L-lactate guanylyltransferase [Actinomycetota bacterium]